MYTAKVTLNKRFLICNIAVFENKQHILTSFFELLGAEILAFKGVL